MHPARNPVSSVVSTLPEVPERIVKASQDAHWGALLTETMGFALTNMYAPNQFNPFTISPPYRSIQSRLESHANFVFPGCL